MLRAFGTRFVTQRGVVNRYFATNETGSAENVQPKAAVIPDVQGLSEKVVKVPNEPVGFKGSTKTSDYKSPEYFCYDKDSYHEAFVEMEDYRLPAPSSKKLK